MTIQKITPFLWFDTQAEEAAKFYTSIFKNSKITATSHYGDAGGGPKGSVMVCSFELEGQQFHAMNGGPTFKFTPAISLMIGCETQEEVDYFWNKLSEGGKKSECGWLDDKFGLSWQVTPTMLMKLMSSGDPVKANRMMRAMMKMAKLDIAELQRAYDGK